MNKTVAPELPVSRPNSDHTQHPRGRRVARAAAAAALCAVLPACGPLAPDNTPKTPAVHSSAVNRTPAHSPGTRPSGLQPMGPDGGTFFYAGGDQLVSGQGVRATLSQQGPYVDAGKNHSLFEIIALSADQKQIIEFGWTVDPGLNGDFQPHLFTFPWINGQPTCYNVCGFVLASANMLPTSSVAVGKTAVYSIIHENNQWDLKYNDELIGYYPDDYWGGAFTQLGVIEATGEVTISGPDFCTDMGNGYYGSAPGAASITDVDVLSGSWAPAHLKLSRQTDTSMYSAVIGGGGSSVTAGGPGAC